MWQRQKSWRSTPKRRKPIIIHDKTVEEVEVFTCSGHHQWDRGQKRINKASAMFNTLGKIGSLKYIPVNTKICIFNSDMENNKTPQKNRVQTFINTCLRRILNICWRDKRSSVDVWKRTNQDPTELQIWRWSWIGPTLRKHSTDTTRQALKWNPQRMRKRGRSKNSGRRGNQAEMSRRARENPQQPGEMKEHSSMAFAPCRREWTEL